MRRDLFVVEREEHARKSGEDAGDHEHGGHDLRNADAEQFGGARIFRQRAQTAAEVRTIEQVRQSRHRRECDGEADEIRNRNHEAGRAQIGIGHGVSTGFTSPPNAIVINP